jgi:hypothetical protein
MSTITAPTIWFKTQRALRTMVQAAVVLFPVVNAVAIAVSAYLQEQVDVAIPAWVFYALNVVIALTALVMGLVARIMAVPGVNDLLTRIGLGSVPRSAVDDAGVLPDPAAVSRAEYQAAVESRRALG